MKRGIYWVGLKERRRKAPAPAVSDRRLWQVCHHRGSWRKTVAFTAPKLRRLPWIYVRGGHPRARTTRFIGAWPSFGRAS